MKKIIALIATALLIVACSSKDKDTQATSSARGVQGIDITTVFAPDPPKKGDDTLIVTLKDGTGAPLKGAIVKVDTSMPSMSMGGPSVTAKDNGDGTYTARLSLQYATSWQFAVTAKADGSSGVVKVNADVK